MVFLTISLLPLFAFQVPLWTPLGPSWAPLGSPWTPLGAHLGVSWACLGVLRGPLGGLWWVQGRLLEPSWPLWEVTWGHLGGTVSRCRSTWCCHGPFWSSQTPSELQFGQFSCDFECNSCSLYHFRLNLSTFAMHFVGVFEWARLGRPGSSQGDLTSRQFDRRDPLPPFNSRQFPVAGHVLHVTWAL